MKTTSTVLYYIQKGDVAKVEAALRREDPDAYQERGPYFQSHRGRYYLVREGDIGRSVRVLMAKIAADVLGGVELTGTQEELHGYACLLESDDCYSCFLGDCLLLVPKPPALAGFVQWMQTWASTQSVGDALLRQALWKIGMRFSAQALGTPEEGYMQIGTPFLLPDDDVVKLYYRKKEETVFVTDLGETLAWLRSQHADPHLPQTVLGWVADICSSLGIEQNRGMLVIHIAASEDLTGSLLRLAQGVLRIAGLQVLLRERASEA